MESGCSSTSAMIRRLRETDALTRQKVLLTPAKDSVDVLIFVSDINKSLGFYEGTLGLERTQEVETPFGTVHWLRYGTSAVKLMDPKQVPPVGPVGLEKQLGIRYLSFEIRNLSGVCLVLQGKGVEFVCQRRRFYQAGISPWSKTQ